MAPKLGSFVAWHWAHKTLPAECRWRGETEWHLGWKKVAAAAGYEIEHRENGRVYDAFNKDAKLALEFQRAIDHTDMLERTSKKTKEHKICWILKHGYIGNNYTDTDRYVKVQVRGGPTLFKRLNVFCGLLEFNAVVVLFDYSESDSSLTNGLAVAPTWLGGYRRNWMAGRAIDVENIIHSFGWIRAQNEKFDINYVHGFIMKELQGE